MAILNAFHILIHKGMLECATSVTRNNFHHGWHIMDGTSFPPGITKIGTTVTPGGLGAIFGGFSENNEFPRICCSYSTVLGIYGSE